MLKDAARVIKQEAKGLQSLAARLDKNFTDAVELLDVEGKIILTGVGKSGYICRKVAATMISLGRQAIFIHPTEAAHGDMGLVKNNDALMVFSRSGMAQELYPLVHFASERGIKVVLISEETQTGLAAWVAKTIKLPRVDEAWGHAPTTSTTMQMAIGDAMAVILAKRHGWTEEDFRAHHPGGQLGAVA
jgi:arabinose-5-phosphate isomerase|tara:strand:- start:11152 stop:11718 length:567 start_codon:yes stop_codon:yes gene_type:complete